MENNNGTLSSYGICPQLTNPILFVLSGADTGHRYQLLEQFFAGIRSKFMVAQLSESAVGTVGSEDLVQLPIPLGQDSSRSFFTALDSMIRKTKLHKYPNNNDLTVCLLFDSSNGSIPLSNVCEDLYQLLTNAYYNRVVFDIYFLHRESFLIQNDLEKQNTSAAKQLGQIQNKEWLRYIFLLSDVSSGGQLTADSGKLFRMVLSSVFLTNCSAGEKSMVQLQDYLIHESESSKVFCLGQTEMQQSAHDIRQMIQAELLQELSANISFRENLPKKSGLLGTLYRDIYNEITARSNNIEHIGCYTYTIPEGAVTLTNADCLDVFFHENPALFMAEAEQQCRQYFLRQEEHYWRQIKVWLDDLLYQYNVSICVPQCEQFVVAMAEEALDKLQQQFYAEANRARELFIEWKNQRVYTMRKWPAAPERFAYDLLEQWRIRKAKEITYSILTMCISDIRNQIHFWQTAIAHKCNLFTKLHSNTDSGWTNLLQDSSSTKQILLQYRRSKLRAYLQNNQWQVDTCRSQLDALLVKQAGAADIANIVSAHTEKLFWEGLRLSLPWAAPYLPSESEDSQVKDLYEILYDALKTDIPLSARRHIHDAMPYLCFFGGSEDRFINYVKQRNEFQYILHFEEQHISPEVFYYQHLPSIEVFFWKELISSGGHDK